MCEFMACRKQILILLIARFIDNKKKCLVGAAAESYVRIKNKVAALSALKFFLYPRLFLNSK